MKNRQFEKLSTSLIYSIRFLKQKEMATVMHFIININ